MGTQALFRTAIEQIEMSDEKYFETEEKLQYLKELSSIPTNYGEQFLHVLLFLGAECGEIRYGFGYKKILGERDFNTLDEAIEIVKKLREYANLEAEEEEW